MTLRDMIKRVARAVFPRSVRNWLRAPSGSFTWILQALSYTFGRTNVIEPRTGWRIKCHPTFASTMELHHLHDPLQIAELNQFIVECKPEMIFIDCGSHFGLFSLAALHFGGPQATVVAIEPSPMAIKKLRQQAALNKVTDRLEIIEACVGRTSGSHSFVPAGVNSSGYFVGKTGENQSSELVKARCVTIDEIVQSMPKPPTHIKIDVEGMEDDVLFGGNHFFKSNTNVMIFLELHNDVIRSQNENPARVLERLVQWGFELLNDMGQPSEIKVLVNKPVTRLLARKMPI